MVYQKNSFIREKYEARKNNNQKIFFNIIDKIR